MNLSRLDAQHSIMYNDIGGNVFSTNSGIPLPLVQAGTEAAAAASDDSNDLMESWGYTGAAIVLGINGFLGFTLNISVIVLMCKDMQVMSEGW